VATQAPLKRDQVESLFAAINIGDVVDITMRIGVKDHVYRVTVENSSNLLGVFGRTVRGDDFRVTPGHTNIIAVTRVGTPLPQAPPPVKPKRVARPRVITPR
jgi:hypothetical protein